MREDDRETIIRKAISEGIQGEELAKEITYRLKQYDDLIAYGMKGFEADLAATDVDDSFNGLDVFC